MIATILTAVIVFVLLFGILIPKMVGYVRRYKGSGLVPAKYPELARTESVIFGPGFYPAGLVVGQYANGTPQSDVQTISIGNANGGNFLIGYNSGVNVTLSAPLAYNANTTVANTVVNAMLVQALGNVACGAASVGGTAGSYAVTFTNVLANMPQQLMSVFNSNMTGPGGGPTFSVAHTTVGQIPGGAFNVYLDNNSDGTGTAIGAVQYDTTVDGLGRHLYGGGEWGETSNSAPIWVSGYFRTKDLTGLDVNAITDMGRLIAGNSSNLTNPIAILHMD